MNGELPMGSLREQMNEHLKKKWQSKSCPMCGGESWITGEDIYAACTFENGALHLGGKMFPMMSAVCTNCGFTAWINAVVSGILETPDDSGDNTK